MKLLLAWMYASRAVLIAAFLFAPKTALTFYLFAAGLGLTWLATLFGLTLLSHQIGGFFGAWLGGLTIGRFGDYNWMWYADIALALLAALLHLPIREARLVPCATPLHAGAA